MCASIIVRLSLLLLLVGVGGGAMTDEERQRLMWLERKVIELLWLTVIAGAAFIGWLTVYLVFTYLIVNPPGSVFVGGWLLGGFILKRHTFRGAPKHIEYLY